jgi:hypothetical protein
MFTSFVHYVYFGLLWYFKYLVHNNVIYKFYSNGNHSYFNTKNFARIVDLKKNRAMKLCWVHGETKENWKV